MLFNLPPLAQLMKFVYVRLILKLTEKSKECETLKKGERNWVETNRLEQNRVKKIE